MTSERRRRDYSFGLRPGTPRHVPTGVGLHGWTLLTIVPLRRWCGYVREISYEACCYYSSPATAFRSRLPNEGPVDGAVLHPLRAPVLREAPCRTGSSSGSMRHEKPSLRAGCKARPRPSFCARAVVARRSVRSPGRRPCGASRDSIGSGRRRVLGPGLSAPLAPFLL